MTTGTNRSKEQNINPAFRPDPFRCGEEGEPSGGGETERNGSGTSKSNNSIRERVRERAVAFAADFQERGYVAFGDPRHSTVAICIALTGDWKSLARWMQFERELPRCNIPRAGDKQAALFLQAFECRKKIRKSFDPPHENPRIKT